MEVEDLSSVTMLSAADYEIVPVLVIGLICTLGIITYICFFGMPGDFQHRAVDFGSQQRPMVKVTNPFVLELDGSTKNLKDDLKLHLSILCPCHLVVVWGPNIQALHRLIALPGRDVKRKMLAMDATDSTDLSPLHWHVLQFDDVGQHPVVVPSPECVTSVSLGEMPRSKYPVAVFIFVKGERSEDRDELGNIDDDNDQMQDNAIIGLFAIFHLRDSVVTKDSHAIAKYVKTAGIPIYSLQALFVASGDKPQQEAVSGENLNFDRCNSQLIRRPPSQTNLRQRVTAINSQNENENDETAHDSCHNSEQAEVFHSALLHKSVNSEESPNNENVSCDRTVNTEQNVDNEAVVKRIVLDGGIQSSAGCEDNRVRHSSDIGASATSRTSTSSPECVVCQSSPAQCALLPCRHNCVCLRCLRLLHSCPLCRSVFDSYFLVTGLQESDDDGGEEEADEQLREMQRRGLAAHMEHVFEGINQMVGFA